MKKDNRSCIILLSGGIDSTTCLYIAKRKGYHITALSLDYQQNHALELLYAKQIIAECDIQEHHIFKINLSQLATSSSLMENSHLEIPQNNFSPYKTNHHIPNTYVPGRNLIFLSIASSIAENKDIYHIFMGANIVDYSGYPDCRPKFLRQFQKTVYYGSKLGREKKQKIKIHSPLLYLNKTQIIRKGMELSIPYHKTWSCYKPVNKQPCHLCDSCMIRQKAFSDLDIIDPLLEHLKKT